MKRPPKDHRHGNLIGVNCIFFHVLYLLVISSQFVKGKRFTFINFHVIFTFKSVSHMSKVYYIVDFWELLVIKLTIKMFSSIMRICIVPAATRLVIPIYLSLISLTRSSWLWCRIPWITYRGPGVGMFIMCCKRELNEYCSFNIVKFSY